MVKVDGFTSSIFDYFLQHTGHIGSGDMASGQDVSFIEKSS
jgi:hypothetical protein